MAGNRGENADAVTMDDNVEALRIIAEAVQLTAREAGKEMDMNFFFARKEGGPIGQIRSLIKTPAAAHVTMAIVDIPDSGGYYVSPDTAHTAESIQAFIDGYKNKTLTRIQM